jgi:hypothetical protein
MERKINGLAMTVWLVEHGFISNEAQEVKKER